MEETLNLLVLLAILIGAVWLFRSLFGAALKKRADGQFTIMAYEAGLRFRKGVYVETLAPGRYFTWPAPETITRVDMRQFTAAVAGQEMLTADQMGLRASAVAAYRVSDPKAYITVATSPSGRLYEEVQIALRRRVAAHKLDDLLADRMLIENGLAAEIQPVLAPMGVAIESVAVRDVNLVGPSKQAFADLWKAQKEGLAALERARGEQASLRALANAARLLKGNPELMNLRLLQALAGAPGKSAPTMVLGGAAGIVPVSRDPAPGEAGEA